MTAALRASRTVQVLLVEDNPGDVHLTLEALKSARVANAVRIEKDGEAALKFLRGEGGHQGADRPDLILLDLNLPRKDGHEVLAELRGDPALMSIPVVVLTSSERTSDISMSYELQANCYVTKPAEVDDFLGVVRSISEFWFRVATLPEESNR